MHSTKGHCNDFCIIGFGPSHQVLRENETSSKPVSVEFYDMKWTKVLSPPSTVCLPHASCVDSFCWCFPAIVTSTPQRQIKCGELQLESGVSTLKTCLQCWRSPNSPVLAVPNTDLPPKSNSKHDFDRNIPFNLCVSQSTIVYAHNLSIDFVGTHGVSFRKELPHHHLQTPVKPHPFVAQWLIVAHVCCCAVTGKGSQVCLST